MRIGIRERFSDFIYVDIFVESLEMTVEGGDVCATTSANLADLLDAIEVLTEAANKIQLRKEPAARYAQWQGKTGYSKSEVTP